MSQTPVENEPVDEYQAGWDATMRLVHQGRSWSGHEKNCAFLNDRNGRFADVSSASGLNFDDDGRGVAVVDWDHDGDLDLWLRNRTAPRLRLMLNQTAGAATGSFVAFRLRGTAVNRDAIGARVELDLAGGRPALARSLYAGEGFRSQSSKWLHFGLAEGDVVERIRVRWPGGASETFPAVEAGQRYVLVQGTGEAETWARPERELGLVPGVSDLPESSRKGRVVVAHRIPALTLRYEDYLPGPPQVLEPSGEPTLVNLWASWCTPCVTELRELTDHAEELRKAGLRVVALTVEGVDDDDTTPRDAANLLEQIGYPFESGVATTELLDRLELYQETLYGRVPEFGVPLSLLLDRQGRVAMIYRGAVSKQQLLEDVRLLDASSDVLREASLPFAGRWYTPHPSVDTFLPIVAKMFVERDAEDAVRFLQLSAERQEARLTAESGAEDKAALADTHYSLATALADEQRLRDAVPHYVRTLQLSRDHLDAHIGLGVAMSTLGDLARAIPVLERALELSPDNARVLNNLGLAYHIRGDVPRAMQHYRRSIELDPDSEEVHYNLGQAFLMSGQAQSAKAEFLEALRIDPESLGALTDLAWILATHPDAGLRDAEEAIRLASRAAELTAHEDATILDTLAAAFAEAARFDLAVETARNALKRAQQDRDPELVRYVRLRLSLYEQSRPYREPRH
ncbi:MAG: tetratricopeptide repeat protein [bacterium]|nr:tetratricopeptide repeat protein [bacterium]